MDHQLDILLSYNRRPRGIVETNRRRRRGHSVDWSRKGRTTTL